MKRFMGIDVTNTLILCDCLGSQKVDPAKIEAGAEIACSRVHTALCTRQADLAAQAMLDGEVTIACQQERARFEELAAEIGAELPQFVDIRDRAGWSSHAEEAGPKQAALVAEARLTPPDARALDVQSEGICLILGAPEVALPAAERLCETLAVTVLLTGQTTHATDMAADLPIDRRFEIVAGRLRKAQGTLGNFTLAIDALQQLEPGGRGAFTLTPPMDGAETRCDLILDLSGATSLFPAPAKRDGYLRVDPGDRGAVEGAVFEAAQMVGTFEKPLYVRLEESLCAHSRAGRVGCHNCLDICPTGAISPAGDHVAIDPMVCAGCGACSALCPSGAITYDAPPVSFLFRRIETLAAAYARAGGQAPRLLVHDAEFGAEMIALNARFAEGLPADVIPLGLETISGFGHAEAMVALAAGFTGIDLLLSPNSERDALEREAALANALAGAGGEEESAVRVRLLDISDPTMLTEALAPAEGMSPLVGVGEAALSLGSRRQVTRLAAKALHPGSEAVFSLPEGAPYGAVLVDTEACTLCLSCAGLCPAGALGDNPDTPQLRFQEDACLQCGLCAAICPEDAITLEPRFNLSDEVYRQQVLHEEEPFDCISCGKTFGVRSTIERITEKLAGKHSMFATSEAAKMIQMCDDCRVNAQYHSQNNPFAGAERPRPRTTDDYYSDRKDH
ncbi:4Fe-4S dicluster protein [Brevirhabdus pacifica]|nr:4Fe-4S dicluster protein [Brevirhabdus pacifica]